MKTIVLITLKYWRKHLKNAAALMFSGVLLTAIIFAALMSLREECARFYERAFDEQGHFDVMIANSDDELLSVALDGRTDCDYGVINVFGKLGYKDRRFTYGTISDENNLWHVPLDEGRMPKTANEIAAVSTVLNSCYWIGECGDKITLGGTEYTVVGIINEKYGKNRAGSELCDNNSDLVLETGYYIPLIFVGESIAEPLYRIDLIGGYFDFSDLTDKLYDTDDNIRYAESVVSELSDYLYDYVDHKDHWFSVNCERNAWYTESKTRFVNFLMVIVWLGAAVSVLSVFSVLRGIFIERQGRISMLGRIGMKKRQIAAMYAFECAVFSIIQTIIGIAVGLVAYGGIYLVKTSFLGEKPYSAFTDIGIVYERTLDPFLYAGLISAAVIAAAYLINILTINISAKSHRKMKKPRSLSKGFGAAIRQGGITAVQIISLTLICFSVTIGYMYYTDSGKEPQMWLSYTKPREDYKTNGFSMEKNNIEAYYSCNPPQINLQGEDGRDLIECFPVIAEDFSRGFNDDTAAKLPENAVVTGVIDGTFIAADNELSGIAAINLSNEIVRETFIGLADESFGNFFDEGQPGSKNMYRIPTKLTVPQAISGLSEYAADGEINPDKLNSGEEILLIYDTAKPPIAAGETVTIYSAEASAENSYGLGKLNSASAKIGAAIKLPSGLSAPQKYAVKSDFPCNFLTTAAGAKALGLPCAAYTEVYSAEELGGGIFPLSAEMSVTSLSELKWDSFIDKAAKFAGAALILAVMSLLGFAAYFNGIGLKIRQKSYEISVYRALGMPLSELRKRLFLNGVKIPVISSAAAYILVKITQFTMGKGYDLLSASAAEQLLSDEQRTTLRQALFLDNVMWQVNVEIPTLILFAVICAVTFILTAAALKRFSGNISGDLNTGRTRL
ncbi:MAG: FtsX-like permease family protein [Eubacterium sp.]